MATTTFNTLNAGSDATPAAGGGLAARLQAWRSAFAKRRLRDQLALMDDRLLLDIGICEDEIARVRAREDFMPRSWMVREAA